jgi:hypothetical protein
MMSMDKIWPDLGSVSERTDRCEKDASDKINIVKTALRILTGTERLVGESEACFVKQQLKIFHDTSVS